ncbi:hypothetical protein [Cupriavidus taiwanensis]|nr:hypothetical protein [Cupriavidus taiwanensis]SOY56819.1 hypothetical protein CBM2592_A90114 [Cupriavidus taiwanensis]SOY90723.1 hypothetical protein CBM2591_A90113 [Cupriavidus taiwanensis]SOZ63526.1 hypothetical protein CBM2617_A70090 [Cupriavidus taiwanensis]SOZ82545.1 hypothetical protein CBM2618_A80091 [Cupriavidus taiwanensis]SOZ84411.1 hypothetical protein CBM2622_A80090 [Cupriavidus taiwanensis]
MYQVIDIKTKAVVSSHKDRKQARNKANRLDNVYGAVRYVVRFVA